MNSQSHDGILDNSKAASHHDSEEVRKTKSASLERLDPDNDNIDQEKASKDKEKQFRIKRNILESAAHDTSSSMGRLVGSSATVATRVQTDTAASRTTNTQDLNEGISSNDRTNDDTNQSVMERRMDQKQLMRSNPPATHPGAVAELPTPISMTTLIESSSGDTTNMTVTEMKSHILRSRKANQQQEDEDEETLIQNKTVGEDIKSTDLNTSKESKENKETVRIERESTNPLSDLQDKNSHDNVQPGSQAIRGPEYESERSVTDRELKDDESSSKYMLEDYDADEDKSSAEVMLHAELVIDEERIVIEEVEREQIANAAKEELVSQAVRAQVVSVDEEEHSKRKRVIIFGVCTIVILLVVSIVVGVVVGMKASKSTNDLVDGTVVGEVVDGIPTVAPTSYEYLKGENFFSTTQQLSYAINDYMGGLRSGPIDVESLPVYQFYGPIEKWNVSGLSNFSWAFDIRWSLGEYEDHPFDADLGDWDVSRATILSGMFYGCSNFQGIGLDRWDVSKVTDFSYMFYENFYFDNYNLSSWNTSNAQNMEFMFSGSGIFEEMGIEYWDVSNVENMKSIFSYTPFSGDLSLWNTTSAKNMGSMFSYSLFEGDVSNFNTERVTDMSYMFEVTYFDGDLSHFDTSKVLDMSFMFSESAFSGRNGGIGGWDVRNCVNMEEMFSGAYEFNQDLSTWNVENVVNFNRMFSNAEQFNHSLCTWGALMTVDAIVEDMFNGSGCNNSKDPDISHGGPLCESCP